VNLRRQVFDAGNREESLFKTDQLVVSKKRNSSRWPNFQFWENGPEENARQLIDLPKAGLTPEAGRGSDSAVTNLND
jgi:hypothetical protein